MNRALLVAVLGIALCGGLAQAEERLQLDKTTILGNRESPRVTFVVPWRDMPGDIPAWQPGPALQPFMTPLDRELYHWQLDYLRQLNNPQGGEKPRQSK